MRQIEDFVLAETAAFEANDFLKVKDIHLKFVGAAMKDAKAIESFEELKDLGSPTFNALYTAILASQGIKLEAKVAVGESTAS